MRLKQRDTHVHECVFPDSKKSNKMVSGIEKTARHEELHDTPMILIPDLIVQNPGSHPDPFPALPQQPHPKSVLDSVLDPSSKWI